MKTSISRLILLVSSLCLIQALLPPIFQERRIAKDIDNIAYILQYPNEEHILILQTTGIIRIFKDGALVDTPVLDISRKVDVQSERGLLGMAFDPNFDSNGYFYIFYSVVNANHARVSRFHMNGIVAEANSETVIVDLDPSPLIIHTGGLMFIMNNNLIVFTGDGGISDNAWRMDSLLGKVLRYNLDGSIPSDNPFYNSNVGKYRAIYAYGIRNPLSGTYNFLQKYIIFGDSGVNWEELNFLNPGKNYGWPIVEGKIPSNINAPDNYEEPFYAYKHENGNCAITGGSFYTPLTFSFPIEYVSRYFFGDYCGGIIKTIDVVTLEVTDWATNLFLPVAFITSSNGKFYYAVRGNVRGGNINYYSGELFEVSSNGENAPSITIQPDSVTILSGQNAGFTVQNEGAGPFTYKWMVNGIETNEDNSPLFTMKSASLSDNGKKIKVKIMNAFGSVESNEVVLTVVEDLKLTAIITEPADETMYIYGTTISFSGKAYDNNHPQFDASALTWEVKFHHKEHVHPVMGKTSGISQGTVVLNYDEASANIYYEIVLTVKDSRGITATKSVKLIPTLVFYQIITDPPGLIVRLNGGQYATPVRKSSTAGVKIGVEAPNQVHGGGNYEFFSWSDGGVQSHLFTVPSSGSTTLTASFIPRTMIPGGLRYYYKDGNFDAPPSFVLSDLQSDPILGFDIRVRKSNTFAIKFVGFLNIINEGSYIFHLNGNGGFRFNIDGANLINKPDMNGAIVEKDASVELSLGSHYVELSYFYNEDTTGLDPLFYLTYSNSLVSKQTLPFTLLFQQDPNPCITQTLTSLSQVPSVVNVDSSTGVFNIAFQSSTTLPLNFSIQGPGSLEYVSDFSRKLILTGESGNVTVTYWQHGNSLFCPYVTKSIQMKVINPYVAPEDKSWIAAAVIGGLLVIVVGYIVFRAWRNHQKTLRMGGGQPGDTARRIITGRAALNELKSESISMNDPPSMAIYSPQAHGRKDSITSGSLNIILPSEISENRG